MPFQIKQNDRRPYLEFQLLEADGTTPLDVSGADQVTFIMRKSGSEEPEVNAACTEIDWVLGQGLYEWAEGDTQEVGTFQAEWEILWPGDERQTVPVDTYYSVIVIDDLGDAVSERKRPPPKRGPLSANGRRLIPAWLVYYGLYQGFCPAGLVQALGPCVAQIFGAQAS